MRIEGSCTLPTTPESAYALLMDPRILAACIPGCEELTDDGSGAYIMKMKVALAAMSGDFTGKVAIENPHPPASYRLRIDGTGRIGFLRGHGDLKLTASDDGGTLVSYLGDVHAGGTLAAIGQRVLDTTARMMIRRFFDCLAARITTHTGER